MPLIKKLELCDWSPMCEVVGEALEGITGEKFGSSKEKWQKWWKENRRKEENLRKSSSPSQRL